MKTSKLLLPILAVVAVAQIAVPASMLVHHELTLRHGSPWKFKTAPVDPVDAFRGRYIALRFEQNHAPVAPGVRIEQGRKAFAILENGPDGFARIAQLSDRAPQDKPYLMVRTTWQDRRSKETQFELPFDRFFMEEHAAPAAERAYARASGRNASQTSYALVRVRNGVGVVENVYIGDKPIADYVRGESSK